VEDGRGAVAMTAGGRGRVLSRARAHARLQAQRHEDSTPPARGAH
jgi:hypothetical protein